MPESEAMGERISLNGVLNRPILGLFKLTHRCSIHVVRALRLHDLQWKKPGVRAEGGRIARKNY